MFSPISNKTKQNKRINNLDLSLITTEKTIYDFQVSMVSKIKNI